MYAKIISMVVICEAMHAGQSNNNKKIGIHGKTKLKGEQKK